MEERGVHVPLPQLGDQLDERRLQLGEQRAHLGRRRLRLVVVEQDVVRSAAPAATQSTYWSFSSTIRSSDGRNEAKSDSVFAFTQTGRASAAARAIEARSEAGTLTAFS